MFLRSWIYLMSGGGIAERKRFADHGLDLPRRIHAENFGHFAAQQRATGLQLE